MQSKADTIRNQLQEATTEDIYLVISEATDILASRAGSNQEPPEAAVEDVDPQEATAKALHRHLQDVDGVGMQTTRKLAANGYESLADIREEPFGLTDIDGIGGGLASRLHDAAKDADGDVPQVPQQSAPEESTASQEPATGGTDNRVLAGEARKEVPDGARLVRSDGRLLAVVNKGDDGYTADIEGTTVGHPSKGSPLGNGSGLAWAVGEYLSAYDDGNQVKDEAYFVW